MADIADILNDEMQRHLDQALAAFKPATGESLTECEACGNETPEEAKAARDAAFATFRSTKR